MNERIRELKQQAKEYASKFAYAQAIGQPGYEEKFSEKFAELLIRECAGVCVEQRQYQPKEVYAQAVLSHFGVEK